MIRYFLAKGDTAGSAKIVEGLPNLTCSKPPPRVEIATLGMKTWCTRCESDGYIFPVGARPPGTAPNGGQWALSGDLNICKCGSPVPFEVPPPGRLRTNVAEHPCSWLDGSNKIITPPPYFYSKKNQVSVSQRKAVTQGFHLWGTRHSTDGPFENATQYDTTVDDHSFPIYTVEPYIAPADAVLTGLNMILNGLETLPRTLLRNIRFITLHAAQDEILGSPTYGGPSPAYISATATMDGGLNIYPQSPSRLTQEFIDATLFHESGHLLKFALETRFSNLSDDWARIHESLDDNTLSGLEPKPSNFAMTNNDEDFAETAGMYFASAGSPCEAEGRLRYPERYAFFDKISAL